MPKYDHANNFGYKKVTPNDKFRLVDEVFSSVANKYDIMNDIMSFGIHRIWKKEFINHIPNNCKKMIDMASGTGDIMIAAHKKLMPKNHDFSITACDINVNMLNIARDRAIDNNVVHNVNYTVNKAESIPFADNSFDCYTITFGIRNVTHLDLALKEAHRVLKPGGKFVCMEFSKPNNKHFAKLYDYYSMNFIPKIGECITGDKESYQYFVESIRTFPDQKTFANMIESANFDFVKYSNLTMGIVTIHTAYKI